MTLDEILGKMPGFETLALPDLKTIESRKNNILNQWPDVVVTTP